MFHAPAVQITCTPQWVKGIIMFYNCTTIKHKPIKAFSWIRDLFLRSVEHNVTTVPYSWWSCEDSFPVLWAAWVKFCSELNVPCLHFMYVLGVANGLWKNKSLSKVSQYGFWTVPNVFKSWVFCEAIFGSKSWPCDPETQTHCLAVSHYPLSWLGQLSLYDACALLWVGWVNGAYWMPAGGEKEIKVRFWVGYVTGRWNLNPIKKGVPNWIEFCNPVLD